MSNHYLNLSGLSKFLDLIKGIFATTEQGDKADSAYTHSQSPHAPSNAERNTIVGIQKNGTDLTPNSSTRKVNVTVPTKVSELTNDSGYKTTDNNTTYTITKSGSTITLEGSDGTSSSVSDSNTTYTLSSFGVTATAAELNKLDGVTATATELNYIDGVTSNIQTQLNGKAASSHTHTGTQVTGLTASRALVSNSSGQVSVSGVTSTELGYLDGVTSNIQTQLNGKAALSHTHTGTQVTGLTASRALVSNSSGQVTVSAVTSTELGYLDGVTSNIQTQLSGKASSSHTHSASNITSGTLGIARGGTGGTTAASARANLGAVGLIVSDVEPEGQNVGDIWFMEETVDE